MFPDFFLAGAPKAGTTSLFYYLSGHPEVFMCPVKEPNYFSAAEIKAQQLYYTTHDVAEKKEYESLFEQVRDEKVVGEASVSYLFYPKVAQRIKESVPAARIIILLRDPVARGFSHYLMDSRLGYISIPFEEVIYKNSSSPFFDLYYQQVVELGLYYEQVKRYLDIFGADRVKIYLNEDLKKDTLAVMSSICRFIDVDPALLSDTNIQHNVYRRPRNSFIRKLYAATFFRSLGRAVLPTGIANAVRNSLLIKENKPEISLETRKYLVDFYKEDIWKLSSLIDRDLTPWISIDRV
jgi:hypothetical protein